jgi:SAM-dependent methyltransferase
MKQNVYDDPEFFAGYRALRERGRGLHETTIRPALDELLPDLAGRRVLDLGCGDGWLCRLAAERGAAAVLGLDPSARMLALARERTRDERVSYNQAFVEDAELPAGAADVVLSVLALHYVEDLAAAFTSIARWLAPGGVLVVLLEHPILLAPSPDRGFVDEDGRTRAWRLHSYGDEGPRRERWYIDGVVKHHRTTATIVNAVIGAGLRLERLVEPPPSAEALAGDPGLRDDVSRPPVLGLRAVRPTAPPAAEAGGGARRTPAP